MAYPITDIRAIGPDTAVTLKSDGIRTTVSLLRSGKTPKQRLKIAERIGTDEKRVLDWVTAADRMRVKGVGWEYAELLRAAGVKTVKGAQVPQPAQARPGHGGGQHQAQTGAASALGEHRHPLDRQRQEAAARHSLLIARGACAVSAPRRGAA